MSNVTSEVSAQNQSRGTVWLLAAFGIAAIVLGVMVKGQPWTEPEMFKGLHLDLSKTIVAIGYFFIWLGALKAFFYAPLKQAIDERDHYLEATFEEAEGLKVRMTELKTSYEQKLTESEAEARAQIQQALAEAQTMRNQIIAEARAQAEEVKRKAEETIERERKAALVEMRTQVVEMTLTATERLIGESMDEERQRQLVEKFIDTVEVGK